ncbi:hypothetical protein BDW72DRAFT_123107 [Aspergillus terricola var. indicus]
MSELSSRNARPSRKGASDTPGLNLKKEADIEQTLHSKPAPPGKNAYGDTNTGNRMPIRLRFQCPLPTGTIVSTSKPSLNLITLSELLKRDTGKSIMALNTTGIATLTTARGIKTMLARLPNGFEQQVTPANKSQTSDLPKDMVGCISDEVTDTLSNESNVMALMLNTLRTLLDHRQKIRKSNNQRSK